jgi:dipeptidyl aminopeptidase/acylaminoacyl peptidase
MSATSRMQCFFLSAVIAVSLNLTRCTPPVNYSLMTAPQEGNIALSRVTVDQDMVCGCTVYWKGNSWMYNVRNRLSVAEDGQKIAFMTDGNGTSGIIVRMLDGSNKSFRRPAHGAAIDPCFSPDGKRLAFSQSAGTSWNIYETALDGEAATLRLTNDNFVNVYPRYFPDQPKVLFNHIELSPGRTKGVPLVDAKLWSVEFSNSFVTQYADGLTPSILPKTNTVVAVRFDNATQTTGLWLINLSTGDEKTLFSQRKRGALDPAVSPSGDMVAFVSMTEEKDVQANLDIYTVAIDGSDLKQRTSFPGHDLCPRWSGDGKSLFFISQRGTARGAWNIWKMDIPEHAGSKGSDTGALRQNHLDTVPPATAADSTGPDPMKVAAADSIQQPAPDSQHDSIEQHAATPDSSYAVQRAIDMALLKPGDETIVVTVDNTEIKGVIVKIGKTGVVLNSSGVERNVPLEKVRKISSVSPKPDTGDATGW